jgi:Tfp pilus assembly protein PilN
MDPGALGVLVPVSAIIMFGLVRISRHWRTAAPEVSSGSLNQLEARLDSMEHDLATLHQELTDTQERLDFAERVLSQSREPKRMEDSP